MPTRRKFLVTSAGALSLSLAGCSVVQIDEVLSKIKARTQTITDAVTRWIGDFAPDLAKQIQEANAKLQAITGDNWRSLVSSAFRVLAPMLKQGLVLALKALPLPIPGVLIDAASLLVDWIATQLGLTSLRSGEVPPSEADAVAAVARLTGAR